MDDQKERLMQEVEGIVREQEERQNDEKPTEQEALALLEEERQRRLQACGVAIQHLLEEHRCRLVALTVVRDNRLEQRVEIEALQ